MKKIKYLEYGLALALSIGFTGCGGGGGGDTVPVGGGDTAPVTNTNKYDLRTFINTAAYTIDGVGTVTLPSGDTANLTGTYKSFYDGAELFVPFLVPDGAVVPDEVLLHRHDGTIILTAGTMTQTISTESITHMGHIVVMNNITTAVNCVTPFTPDQITPVPIDAQVGYISDIIPLSCDNGSYITNVIRLDDAGGGNAELSIISNTYEYQGGALQSTETDRIIVTPNMSIVNVEKLISFPTGGPSLTLHSTSIVQN